VIDLSDRPCPPTKTRQQFLFADQRDVIEPV